MNRWIGRQKSRCGSAACIAGEVMLNELQHPSDRTTIDVPNHGAVMPMASLREEICQTLLEAGVNIEPNVSIEDAAMVLLGATDVEDDQTLALFVVERWPQDLQERYARGGTDWGEDDDHAQAAIEAIDRWIEGDGSFGGLRWV